MTKKYDPLDFLSLPKKVDSTKINALPIIENDTPTDSDIILMSSLSKTFQKSGVIEKQEEEKDNWLENSEEIDIPKEMNKGLYEKELNSVVYDESIESNLDDVINEDFLDWENPMIENYHD